MQDTLMFEIQDFNILKQVYKLEYLGSHPSPDAKSYEDLNLLFSGEDYNKLDFFSPLPQMYISKRGGKVPLSEVIFWAALDDELYGECIRNGASVYAQFRHYSDYNGTSSFFYVCPNRQKFDEISLSSLSANGSQDGWTLALKRKAEFKDGLLKCNKINVFTERTLKSCCTTM